MKKVLALVLAVVLSLGALSVFAATTPTRGAKIDEINKSGVVAEIENYLHNTAVPSLDGSGRPYLDLPITGKTYGTMSLGSSDLDGWTTSSKSGLDSVRFHNGAGGDMYETGRSDSTTIRLRWAIRTTTSTSDFKMKGSVLLKDQGGTKMSSSNKIEVDRTIDTDNTDKDNPFYYEYSEGGDDDYDSVTITQGQVMKFTEGGRIELTTSPTALGEIWIQTRVSKNARINAAYSSTTPSALEDAYPFVTLDYFAPRSLSLSNWKVFFLEYEETDTFIYGYADGKLYNLPKNSVGTDKDEDCIVVTGTGSLPAFVLSSVDLGVTGDGTTTSGTTTTPSGTTSIPNTGSSDMVSAAVVMAVVSLAAAGAVAFKKTSK